MAQQLLGLEKGRVRSGWSMVQLSEAWAMEEDEHIVTIDPRYVVAMTGNSEGTHSPYLTYGEVVDAIQSYLKENKSVTEK